MEYQLFTQLVVVFEAGKCSKYPRMPLHTITHCIEILINSNSNDYDNIYFLANRENFSYGSVFSWLWLRSIFHYACGLQKIHDTDIVLVDDSFVVRPMFKYRTNIEQRCIGN